MRLPSHVPLGLLVVGLTAWPAIARAQQDGIGFAEMPPHVIAVPDLTDAQISGLLGTLDSVLARQTDAAKWGADAHIHFWRLMNRLQAGRVSAAQEATILAHFDQIEKAHPADKALVDSYRSAVQHLTIGKVAPDIVGKDYDGIEFKLSDYRGKVTVIYFTGQWCGPCRGEYPYERLMLEVHKNDPFAIVSVNSDDKIETAKQAKIDNKLDFRSWWDGYVPEASTKGPIASAWNVTGWPAIYVLDAKGVIRFAQLRQEDILKAVNQLLEEQRATAVVKK
jgi:thiol-disulfide isomerase/thioredoxin